MNNIPRQKLAELIATYGKSLSDDPRRCEGLLRDVCGEHRREIHVLVNALKEGVVTELTTASVSAGPPEVILTRLIRRLQENLGLTEDAARWSVESWALALGVIPAPNRKRSTQSAATNRTRTRKASSQKPQQQKPQASKKEKPQAKSKPSPATRRTTRERVAEERMPAPPASETQGPETAPSSSAEVLMAILTIALGAAIIFFATFFLNEEKAESPRSNQERTVTPAPPPKEEKPLVQVAPGSSQKQTSQQAEEQLNPHVFSLGGN